MILIAYILGMILIKMARYQKKTFI